MSFLYDLKKRNIVEPERAQITIWNMLITCLVPKATNTHPSHVKLIPFPLQQLLHERASILRYMYVDCLVKYRWKRPAEIWETFCY